jgi:hypothetical protein
LVDLVDDWGVIEKEKKRVWFGEAAMCFSPRKEKDSGCNGLSAGKNVVDLAQHDCGVRTTSQF